MTRYAKLMSEALAEVRESAKKITKKERDSLENDNQHGELALKLAQSFGTPQEVKKIKDINKRHMQKGSIDPKDQKERDAISNKYYKMAEDNKYRNDIQSQTTHENDLTHSKEENQPEWGTDESTLKAKKMTPGESDLDEKKTVPSMLMPMSVKKDIEKMMKDRKYKGNTDAFAAAVKKKYSKYYDNVDVQGLIQKHAETNESNRIDNFDENYRKLAMKGIGTETKKGARVGLKTDYYLPKNGDKSFGKITRVTSSGYEITDEKTKKVHKFKFYDPNNDPTSVRGTREEVEITEKVSKELAAKVLSMNKNQKFVKVGNDYVPEIYLSASDRDKLKSEFGRLPRGLPSASSGIPVVDMINHALGKDGVIDTEGGDTSSPKLISWDKGGKTIGRPKTVGDAAKIAGVRLESVELDEANYRVTYSTKGKLFSKKIRAKSEDEAEDIFVKQFKDKKIPIDADDIRSVVKEGYEGEVLKVLDDAGIDGYFKNNKLYVSRRDAKGAKKALDDSDEITNLPKMVMEETELDEKYDLYHKSFSDAMQHAYDYAKKKMGITVDPKEIDSKVATGPKKPSEGKTNTYRLKGRGGNLQIQVYNKGGSKPFELNMYKEEVVYFDENDKRIDEMFDYVLIDKDNKIVGRYSGKDAKKDAQSGMRSAHLPPMRIPKNEVGKMKIIPINPKDKKSIGDMVLAIGEELDMDEGKMKQMHQMMDDGKTAEEIAKALKLDLKSVKALMKEDMSGKDVAKRMMKMQTMKPFASKVAKMKTVSHDDLEKMLPDYVAGSDIEKVLKEGMWAMASKPNEISALKKLMQRPIPVGDPEKEIYTKEMDALYGLLGDDELFDMIGVLGDKKGAKADARPVIMKWFAQRIKDNYGGYGERTKELAKAIGLKKIAAAYEENGMTKSLKDTILEMWAEASNKEAYGGTVGMASYDPTLSKKKKKKDETNKNDKSDDGDGLDAVQPKAVKKKFKDRKDKDIDNDGDVDDSDKFLHKRRKAVSKAVKSETIQRYHETKEGSLRDAILQMWGESSNKEAYGGVAGMASYDPTLSKKKKDEKDEEKGLTKKEKNDTMTDTGKKITPVEISPKMAKIKNEKNRV